MFEFHRLQFKRVILEINVNIFNSSSVHEGGFVPNALDLFVGKTGSGDYHTEMNGLHYEDYIKKMAPNLPDKTVLVIDKASYHSVMTGLTFIYFNNFTGTYFCNKRGEKSVDDRQVVSTDDTLYECSYFCDNTD